MLFDNAPDSGFLFGSRRAPYQTLITEQWGKNIKKIGSFLLILFVCVHCNNSFIFAEELKILTVEEPPSSFLNDKGEPAGFAVDIVREIQHRIKNSNPIQFVPEIRALKIASESPNVVLFSFSRTPEREDSFHWIMLLIRKPWVMYSKKQAGLALKNIDEAKKIKSIGVVRGDVRAQYLEQMGFSNLEQVENHELNVKKLKHNRIRMLSYEPMGMSFVCNKLGIPMSDFEPVLQIKTSEVYLMMSKKGTDPETLKRWTDAARQIKEDGTFQRIAVKWAKIINEQHGIFCEVKDGALNF